MAQKIKWLSFIAEAKLSQFEQEGYRLKIFNYFSMNEYDERKNTLQKTDQGTILLLRQI